ncbi:amidohydrolase [Rhizobium sp. SSA_523]|uniref:amidohydrolase family protein n=1 Tax=Rhizobium sp. SSA_523 TaxID=2952477 RepID=UPI002091754D|nr:amidohydrolase family protein [Rhizobium sp. SSA_523]MCO5734285.1 amidohydrolase family protein [Rhizobium sp. SSA_523]WKC21444.1 amidohydrolase family protein [Rhizobium sp. SSA_523]
MIIDAHQHFWLMANRQGQWPPPELAAIHRDFLPADLEPQLKAAGVDATIVVQSLPSLEDTRFLLDLAERHAFVLGVVGWVDLKASNAAATIADMAAHPKLKGLRPMLQDIDDDGWIDDPALDPAIKAMIEAGLAFDALVLPRHLQPLMRFVERHRDLRIVIDHGAKPVIAKGLYGDWRRAMERLAQFDTVSCKLSGLLTEAGDQRPEAVRPYGETILELFGPDRVIWGSDWPVLTLAADYRTWFAQARDMVPAGAHAQVFGGNARRFYRL